MKWLAHNYKWLFDGIGVLVIIGVVGYLLRRFMRAAEPAYHLEQPRLSVDMECIKKTCRVLSKPFSFSSPTKPDRGFQTSGDSLRRHWSTRMKLKF